MNRPARLAEPGERFIVFGADNPKANGKTGLCLDFLNPIGVERIRRRYGLMTPEPPLMAVTIDGVVKPDNVQDWVYPQCWLYALDDDDDIETHEDERQEVEA